ncbi:MAG: leucine-rich repeat domain-containing protein, partial [Thermoguttaceae bacterium]|nr:leucine-rich repeat domain-containing protein [Thermoguttaceae bacterium]
CDALKSVAFPDGLQTIGASAFDDCWSLKSVSFPDGLRTIGEDAFGGCFALKSVELPRETKRAQNAFPSGCEVRVR